ncbi:MAG: nickel/cobalt transporter [Vibrio sp.]
MSHIHEPRSPSSSAIDSMPPPQKIRYLTLSRALTIGVVTTTVAILIHFIYSMWPHILIMSVQWQRSSVDQLSGLIYDSVQSRTAMYSLIEVSFLYGIFHSLGPGHGKLIVSTYLATNPAKIKMGLMITVVSALVQALVAIGVVSVFLFVLKQTMRHVNAFVGQIFSLSYVGVLLIGAIIFYQGMRYFYKQWRSSKHAHQHGHDHDSHHHHDHHHEHSHEHQPQEDGSCSCGHKHIATPNEINRAKSVREYIAIIMSIGIRPCTGAILVLFFANLAHQYWVGVFSAVIMSVGTACTTSTIALATVSGRQFVQRYLKDDRQHFPWVAPTLRILSGVTLMLVSYVLFHQTGFGVSPIFNVH